jgi:hypothetical protein
VVPAAPSMKTVVMIAFSASPYRSLLECEAESQNQNQIAQVADRR